MIINYAGKKRLGPVALLGVVDCSWLIVVDSRRWSLKLELAAPMWRTVTGLSASLGVHF